MFKKQNFRFFNKKTLCCDRFFTLPKPKVFKIELFGEREWYFLFYLTHIIFQFKLSSHNFFKVFSFGI